MSLIIFVLPLLYALPCILGLILLDLVLGIGAAVKTNTFKVNTLPQFLQTQVLTCFLPIIVLVALAQVNWSYFGTSMGITSTGIIAAAWAAISFYVAKILFVNIVANLSAIFGITVTVSEEAKTAVAKKADGYVRLSVVLIIMVLVLAVLAVVYLL
jgi:hypothetical protein